MRNAPAVGRRSLVISSEGRAPGEVEEVEQGRLVPLAPVHVLDDEGAVRDEMRHAVP